MIFDSSKPFDAQRAKAKFDKMIQAQRTFELTEKRPIRSISQNSYEHLLFSYFAMQTGYTEQEVKQEIFKKIVNPELFYEGEITGIVTIERWRSTRELTTAETTTAIERFRNYSAMEAGIYLPSPTDFMHLREIEIELSRTAKEFM